MRFKAVNFWQNFLPKLSICGSRGSLLSTFTPRQTVALTMLNTFDPIVIGLIGPANGLFVSISLTQDGSLTCVPWRTTYHRYLLTTLL